MARNPGTPTTAPPAVRASTPGWRDPRLWVGVLLVAVSVVAGAKLVGSADDTVAVWAAAGDLGAGDLVGADDLVATRVRFGDAGALDGYFTVDDELPADLELTRGIGAGELLPRAAVGTAGESDTLQVPLAVDAEQVPGSVQSGSVVDVYLVPSSAGGKAGRGATSEPALAAVTVVDAPALDEGFAATGKRQLVLAVADADARRFFALLGSYDSPVVTVVRRG
ncbi:hypothetical protein H5V45_06065 [Nocardioides sp. KIGAM211]|uniref:SAF domain-containing protein n=1 Tax=Nocardioides luti TaxID=2761101 RepID=A0A7X0REQ6_9ACTN|nr:hypothetical protein [Nocardioides luti]MBB6626882.1 hypothetical protein [Nocardioides luti]